jgi:hypothetical protein
MAGVLWISMLENMRELSGSLNLAVMQATGKVLVA